MESVEGGVGKCVGDVGKCARRCGEECGEVQESISG